MTPPKSISYKCERCEFSSNGLNTFLKPRQGRKVLFYLCGVPVWMAGMYFLVVHNFETKDTAIGLGFLVVLFLLWIWSQPSLHCPRCEGREVKEIFHY